MRQKTVTDGHKQGLRQVESDRGNPIVPTKRVIASTSFSHRFVIPSCQFRQRASSLHYAAPPPQSHQCSASMSCAADRNDGARACCDMSQQDSGQAVLKALSPTFASRRIIIRRDFCATPDYLFLKHHTRWNFKKPMSGSAPDFSSRSALHRKNRIGAQEERNWRTRKPDSVTAPHWRQRGVPRSTEMRSTELCEELGRPRRVAVIARHNLRTVWARAQLATVQERIDIRRAKAADATDSP